MYEMEVRRRMIVIKKWYNLWGILVVHGINSYTNSTTVYENHSIVITNSIQVSLIDTHSKVGILNMPLSYP